VPFTLLKEVQRINADQKERFLKRIRESLWVLREKRIAVWGLTFKPDTDDVRCSVPIDLVNDLIKEGAIVTAVTSTANLALARASGAAEVIDYTVQNISAGPESWNIVADTVGALGFRRALPILADGGRYLAIAGGLGDLLARPRHGRRCLAGPAAERADDLAALADLAQRGIFRPPIDAIFPFEALPEAHARADTGRKRGSVVVSAG
jgi:NADPH:quinone reductase-like Zn-dependent oxidoreductase